ncbi:MAG TPA: hypothetical protein O0X05_03900, partial [Methanocorpusculum sp.]|nr:hypothetical protein [Methanocorpusculum sp.]
GLGLTTTPLTTLIMSAAPASKQGMVSSLTGLERFAPMTIGVAVYNIIFMHGIMAAVRNSGITENLRETLPLLFSVTALIWHLWFLSYWLWFFSCCASLSGRRRQKRNNHCRLF